MKAKELLSLLDKGRRSLRALEVERSWPLSPSVFGSCSRELALRLSGHPRVEESVESLRVFELGHLVECLLGDEVERLLEEELLQRTNGGEFQRTTWVPVCVGELAVAAYKRAWEAWPAWPEAGKTYRLQGKPGGESEQTFEVLGTMDLLLEGRTVVDFKSSSSYGFGLLEREGPKEEHVVQVMAYMHGLLREDNQAGVGGILVYLAKDADARRGHVGGQLRAFDVSLDDEEHALAYSRALARIRDVLRGWVEGRGEMIEPSVERSGRWLPWQCNYCSVGPLAGGCWTSAGEVADQSTSPKRKRYKII